MSTEYFILSVRGSKTLKLSLQKQAWTKFSIFVLNDVLN